MRIRHFPRVVHQDAQTDFGYVPLRKPQVPAEHVCDQCRQPTTNPRFCSRRCAAAHASSMFAAKHKRLREFGPAEGERYYINEINGWKVTSAYAGGSKPVMPCSFSVVDDAYGREVARFETVSGYRKTKARAKAEALCDELNADERAWENNEGPYSQTTGASALACVAGTDAPTGGRG